MDYSTPNIFSPSQIAQLQRMVGSARRIVLTCHVSPDGDAMGSTLGACRMLNNMGKLAVVVTPDKPPKTLDFMKGMKDVVCASYRQVTALNLFKSADLVICLDFNLPKRVDKLEAMLLASPAPKIMIDHHLDPGDFCDLVISYPELSSTCELFYRLAEHAGWLEYVDCDCASSLLTGMMTDTGNFSYNCPDPVTFVIEGALVSLGADKKQIYDMAMNTKSENCVRIQGYAVSRKMQLFPEHQAALIVLDRDELREFGYVKGDTEGLVNVPLSIPGITYSAFLREDEGQIKVSMRSQGSFPVNKFCEDYFDGGGHLNAAGGEMHVSLEETVEIFLEAMPLFDKYLKPTIAQ